MKNFLKKIYYNYVAFDDGVKYYGNYKGSFNKFRSFFWNIINIKRILIIFKYKVLSFNKVKNFFLLKIFIKSISNKKNQNIDNEIYISKFNELINNGGVVIENFFSKEIIDNFLIRHKNHINSAYDIKGDLYNNAKMELLTLSNELLNIWLDEKIILILKTFYNSNIYARNYPYIGITRIDNLYTSKEKFRNKINLTKTADDWHVDHSTLFNVHVILEDLTANDPHMEFAQKTHKYFNSTFPYSEEEIDSKKFNIVKCIGKKGTVYMHYGNTLHRLKLKPSKSIRSVLHLEFSPGPNILLNVNNIANSLKEGFDLSKLDSDKRDILKGIYPISYIKGYELNKKNELRQNFYKGI